jgi:hypothetical protein
MKSLATYRRWQPNIFAIVQPRNEILLEDKPNTSNSLLDDYFALNMNSMQPAFFLLLVRHSLAIIAFLLEILYFKICVHQHYTQFGHITYYYNESSTSAGHH